MKQLISRMAQLVREVFQRLLTDPLELMMRSEDLCPIQQIPFLGYSVDGFTHQLLHTTPSYL